jgi:hypothetical protein
VDIAEASRSPVLAAAVEMERDECSQESVVAFVKALALDRGF